VALLWLSAISALLVASCAFAQSQSSASIRQQTLKCSEAEGIFCAEQGDIPGYEYVGHDEPSLLFYSGVAGSGSGNVWRVRLPKDPVQLPRADGKGTTWNFQLHPAFWFDVAMCDTQSFREFTQWCKPGSDDNIFDSSNPASPRYIGRHPGAAFMEMQFYPRMVPNQQQSHAMDHGAEHRQPFAGREHRAGQQRGLWRRSRVRQFCVYPDGRSSSRPAEPAAPERQHVYPQRDDAVHESW
jgi:hypothetical protein